MDVTSLNEQERYQLLVNAISDYAIYMLDAEGHVVSWNSGAQRFKGYQSDEVLGRHFRLFFTDDDRSAEAPEKALRIAARDGRYETEGWRVRKDGSRFWAHAVVDAIRGTDNDLIGYAKVVRDITEKKRAETELRSSEERFRLLVQGVKDCAIYMLDSQGIVTNWNLGAETIKGYHHSEIIGQHFSKFYTEEDRENAEPTRALQIALEEGKYEREAWRVRKDGSLFWAQVLIDPIFDEDGNHLGFAKVTRDMTERKLAQERFDESQRNLHQSQKLQAVGQLTGGIAHDFNNMLTVITGSADFLRRNRAMPEEEKLRYVDGIIETAARAASLTNQLLAFARKQPTEPQVFDVGQRLLQITELLSRTLGNQIKIDFAAPADGICVEVDPNQFEAALLNAAVNARDAMPNGGILTWSAERELIGREAFVRIALRDTGEGMSDDIRRRAFDPFFTTKEVGKGTGLGLSQFHGFAAQAGGFAEIVSAAGAGTTISLILPLSLNVPPTSEDSAPDAAVVLGTKVLLVEDNEGVREFTHALLADLGCEVVLASDAAEALALVEESSVDVVVSDIVMPGMSGIKLAEKIRRRWPELPIVLLTGYSEEVAANRPPFPILTKPFNVMQLQDALIKSLYL